MKRFLRLHAFFFALTRPNKIKARIPLGQALDIGFFELEDGYIEPVSMRSPFHDFAGGRIERYYYPFLASNLPASQYVLECDENIRVGLYNHPLRVVPHNGKHVIIAESRESSRYPTTKSREE